MLERELALKELWRRMSQTPGVAKTARNPVKPPAVEDMPVLQLFDGEDKVTASSKRGRTARPAYTRSLEVVVEAFIQAPAEASVTDVLTDFVQDFKTILYQDGVSLGLKGVEMGEVRMSPVYRPPGLERVGGIGIVFQIKYVEDLTT